MSQSDPWSVYNLRLACNRSADGSQSQRHPSSHGSDSLQSHSAPHPIAEALDRAVVPTEKYDHLLLEQHATNPPPFLLTGDDIQCGHCSVSFTGIYRRGNLSQHVRAKHTQSTGVSYPCRGHECRQCYKRADARLNHERKRHPELSHPPVQRRRGGSSGSLTSSLLTSSIDGNDDGFAEPREAVTLTELDIVLKGTDTFPIWEQRPVDRTGPLPNLFDDCSSDLSQGQESLFSSEHRSGWTATEASSTSEPSDLRYVAYTQSEDFGNVTRYCPAPNCVTEISSHRDFVSHFKREHLALLRDSSTNRLHIPSCNLCFLLKEEGAIIEHLWNSHVLVSCLDDQMNDLDLGAEFEHLPIDWFPSCAGETRSTSQTTSSEAPEVLFSPNQNQEYLRPIVEAASRTLQTASPYSKQENRVSAPSTLVHITDTQEKLIDESLLPADIQQGAHIIPGDLEILPRFGLDLIDRMSAELEPQIESQLWIGFFNRWERILEVLQSRRSETHHLFAPLLEVLRKNVHLHGVDVSNSACSEGQRAYTNNEPLAGSKATRKRSSSSNVTPGEQKRIRQAVSSASGNDGRTQVKQADKRVGESSVRFACVIYKHHLMHGTLAACPCDGFSASSVSRLCYDHLKLGRAHNHGGQITFHNYCKHCEQDVVDQVLWTRHEAKECAYRSKKPKAAVRMAHLYLAMYPDALQIPNSYEGQDVWLSDAECEKHRQSVSAIFPPPELASDSFLDHNQPSTIASSPSTAEAAVSSVPLNDSTETADERLHRSAAYTVLLADVQSHRNILGKAMQLVTSLAEESARIADSVYCGELADQVEEQLFSVIANLRQNAEHAPNQTVTSIGSSPETSNERYDIPSPGSETASSRSRSAIRPSTHGRRSGSSSYEISTATTSVFTLEIVDGTQHDDRHRTPLSGIAPAIHSDICYPSGSDQAVARPCDDPASDANGADEFRFEDFVHDLN